MGKSKSSKSIKKSRRKIIDESFLGSEGKRYTTNISEFIEEPHKKSEVCTLVPPKENTDLNKDSSWIFEITSLEDEVFSFYPDYHLRLEVSITQELFDAADATKSLGQGLLFKKKIGAADAKDPNPVAFQPSSSGLSLFNDIDISYMNYFNERSLTYPQSGTFLNILAAQDLLFAPESDFHKIQNSLNNEKISPNFMVGQEKSITPDVNMSARKFSKIHTSATDAPYIEGVINNPVSANNAASGKIHYVYIPRNPFVAVNNYLHNRYKLPYTVIFPPNSTLRIVFHKNQIPMKYLMENQEADSLIQASNGHQNFADATFNKRNVKIHIHKAHLLVKRTKLIPSKEFPLNSYFFSNIMVNHFDLIELSQATSKKIPIIWRTEEPPLYIIISFIRQQDIVFNSTVNLPQALNKFFLPQFLTSISIRQRDYINELYDGIQIKNLDKPDYHPSKAQYIEYIKRQGFVGPDFTFEELFCTDVGKGGGFCNCFPISLVGRDISSSLYSKGLELELEFTQSNTTGWFASARLCGLGHQNFTKLTEKQYKVEFSYDKNQ